MKIYEVIDYAIDSLESKGCENLNLFCAARDLGATIGQAEAFETLGDALLEKYSPEMIVAHKIVGIDDAEDSK